MYNQIGLCIYILIYLFILNILYHNMLYLIIKSNFLNTDGQIKL